MMVLLGMVTAYLVSYAKMDSGIRVCWTELPIIMAFLLSIHILIGLLDHVINTGLSRSFSLIPAHRFPKGRNYLKDTLRFCCVIAIAAPFLTASFLVYWIKFQDNDKLIQQTDSHYETVQFCATDGTALEGWFIHPKRSSNSTVIIVPGRGRSKGCFLNYADMLTECGYNVLLFDLRGEGSSSSHTRGFGILETRDIHGAIQYLERYHPANSQYLFGFGISQGAAAMIRAAGEDTRLRAVVIDSPIINSFDSQLRPITQWLPKPLCSYYRTTTLWFASLQTGCNLQASDIKTDIAKIGPRPILIFHGEQDTIADVMQAKELFETAQNPKMLCLVPGAGHTQTFLYARNQCLSKILAFFDLAKQTG